MFDKKLRNTFGIIVVYGFAHEENKLEFWTELAASCNDIDFPYIVGGVFNILRHVGDKNKKTKLAHSWDVFNYVINMLCLRETDLNGGMYSGVE